MCTEVYKHQHNETGGNLFGLWTTSGSAVIHVVLGPGKNCRRTETSFHQDIEYMHRVGRFVNDNYMFCHIGEWHSHHSLAIKKPSTGDEQTVRCNFPESVAKFLVVFATIKNTDIIVLSPYFFIDEGRRYEKAELVVLDSDNAFSHDVKIMAQVQFGAEGVKHQLAESNRGGVTLTTKENPLNTHLDSQQSIQACFTCPRDPRETSPSTGMNPQPQKGNNNSASNSQAKLTSSQPSEKNANNVASIKGSDSETKRKGSRQTPRLTSHNTKTRQNKGSKSQRDGNSSSTYDQPNLSSTRSKPDPNIPAPNSNASQSQAHPHKLKSKYDQSISNNQIDPSLSKSQDIPSESTSGDSEEAMDTDHGDLILRDDDNDITSRSEISPSESETITPVGSPAELSQKSNNGGLNSRRDNESSSTRSQATSPNSQPTRRNANGGTSMDTLDFESQGCGPNRPAHSQTTDDSPKHGTVQNQTASGEGEMASTKEIILKKIKDELEKYFGREGNIDMERTNNGVIQMTFKHRSYYWRLSFPQNFPKQPAQLVSAYSLGSLSMMSPRSDNSLTNYVDILLSVKKQCFTSTCNICKSISRESLTEPCIVTPEPATAMPAGNTSLKDAVAAVKNELEIAGIATPLSLFTEPQNDQSCKIKFRHYYRNWLVTFPPEFPDKPAEVYQKEGGYRPVSKKVCYFSNTKHEEVALVSSDLIMSAIYKNCDCFKCGSKKR